MRQPVPFGKYLLLERISVGGMAEVFKAKAFGVEGFEKILAIKRILPSMAEDADFIQMFIDEAKISGQLNHQNIAQIFELGRVEDSHFIAMEYVWGKDLLQIQNRFRRMKKTMPFDMAAYCVAKMCEGLDYAHKKKDASGKLLNIIHRDVSPQNVLCSYDGEVKVIDFGIAKAASRSTKTQAGVLKGKFGYMSPEQVRGLPLDRRSDVFAIATILYELLTAERLFLGESDFATLEKVRNVDIPPPSKVVPGCPPAIEKIILKGLAKDVEDRYQWASEMNEDLLQYLSALDPPFTIKQLAAWMKEQFSAELKRETQVLEEQKKMTREMKAPSQAAVMAGAAAAVAAPASSKPNATMQLSTDDIESLDGDLQEEPEAPLAGEATQISTEMPPEVLALLNSQNAEPKPLANESTQILSDKHPPANDLKGQSTMILDVGSGGALAAGGANGHGVGANGPGLPPLQGQSTVMLEAPSYPPPRAIPMPGRDHITGQTGINPMTSQVDRLPYQAPKRSTLGRDLAIGVLVALLVVGGVLGGRYFLVKGEAKATLVVTVTPAGGAKVLVDGVDKGKVSSGGALTLKDLAPGPHKVVVKGEAGEYEQSVTLASNDVSVITATLAGGSVPKATLPAAGTAGTGRLKLNLATEGATVFIDGAQLDDGSWKEPIPIKAGASHEFKVSKPGFEDAKFTVTLAAGEDQSRDVHLDPAVGGHLEVKTDPSGADVNVNGKSVGQTPVKLDDVDTGKQARVTIRKSGFASVTKYVSFDKDKNQALEIKLASASGGSSSSSDDPPPSTTPKKGDEGTEKPPKGGEKVTSDGSKGDAPSSGGTGDGFLVANTQPWAKVVIDGKDTGKTTPIAPRSKIPLKPGKHKVTFMANGKKYDFEIVVKPGEDFRLIKQLDAAQ